MASTTKNSSSRSRNKPASAAPRSNGSPRSRAASSRSGSSSRSRSSAAARGSSQRSSSPSRQSSSASSNGRGAAKTARQAVGKLCKPALAGGAAVAGILGGVAIGAKALPRKRSFPASIGIPLNGLSKNLDVKKARKQIGRASKQFGALTKELRKAGEQAERIGDALS
jgi:hypothetical protein